MPVSIKASLPAELNRGDIIEIESRRHKVNAIAFSLNQHRKRVVNIETTTGTTIEVPEYAEVFVCREIKSEA